MNDNVKALSRNEIKSMWKQIDRKLKRTTTDTEISGKPNDALTPLELLPLEIPEDKLTLLGSLNANNIAQRSDMIEIEKLNRIRRYERLRVSQDHPEIDGCISIYADEATTEDQFGNIIHVEHPNKEVEDVVTDCFERIGLDDKSWQIIKNFSGFGDEFYELVISKTGRSILKIDKLPRNIIERVEENNILQGFKITSDGVENDDPYYTFQTNYQTKDEEDKDLIYPFRILHFKTNSDKYGVYGQSIIDTVINTIDQLKMMEKSLVVARVTRAPERRVYTIDVGNLQSEKAIKYANSVINNFKGKKRMNFYDNAKSIDMQKDIFGTVEDIVIPKRQGSEGNSIATLEQANNLSDTGDLEFLRDKIFPALGIPRQYFYDDTFANANANLSSKSVPFAKKIKRIQRAFLTPCYKIAIVELKLKGYSNEEISQLTISMNNPSNIDEREKISLEMEKWGLVSSMKALNAEGIFYPDYLIYQDVLKLNKDEIALLMKLNILQENGQNPFDIFDIDERPDLAKDLAVTPNEGEGGGVGGMGGGMAGGGMDDMGGDMGGDIPEEGGGSDEGGGGADDIEIPSEVEDKLGPAPEKTEVMDDVAPQKTAKMIAEEKKKKVLYNFYNEVNTLLNKKDKKDQEEEASQYVAMDRRSKKRAFAEIFLNGQLEGIDKVNKEVVIYSEEEDFLNIL